MWGQPPSAVQSSEARRHSAPNFDPQVHNPETPHRQSKPARARGRTGSASPSLKHAHTTPSDYSDAPTPSPASATSPLSQSSENPSATRGRKSADTAPASHPASPPETQTADNSA